MRTNGVVVTGLGATTPLGGDAAATWDATATKSMTGHLFGAAGALGAIAAILAVRGGVIPATRNLDVLDPAVGLDVVRGKARPARVDAAVANAFGFGGHNAALVFTKAA